MHKIGIIFDWDGVIVDSSRQHEESWNRLAEEEKRSLPRDHFVKGFGKKNDVIIPEILKWSTDQTEIKRLSLRKEALYRAILAEGGLAPLPGVIPFLETLDRAGVPNCIGSSTERLNIETILKMLKLHDYFPQMVTGEDVTRGKPDPEVFLKAADKIGCRPIQCIVFEDAFAGMEAARVGGMKVVGVATTHSAAEIAPFADKIVHRLDELSLDGLMHLIASPSA